MHHQHYSLRQAPAIEPVSLQMAKEHLLVSHTQDDLLITRLISAAVAYVENATKRQLITSVWDLTIDGFPTEGDRIIYLSRGPVQAGKLGTALTDLEILYLDTSGVQQILDPAKYRLVPSAFSRIQEAYNESWPDTYPVIGSVTITFVAGYGDTMSGVPEDLIGAILLLIGAWFENRDSISGNAMSPVPFGVDSILDPYRLLQYC